jgi:hypothetical protein
MALIILCVFPLTVFVAIGACKLRTWESSRHMINAEWMDCSDKFGLIARWGAK